MNGFRQDDCLRYTTTRLVWGGQIELQEAHNFFAYPPPRPCFNGQYLLLFHPRQPGAHILLMVIMEMVEEITRLDALIP